jgi:orotidine-5'-phosphate decarboxylase
MAEVIVALDVPTTDDALRLVEELGPAADFYKVGLELFTAEGPAVVRELVARDKRVFLDLKLHDIPNTVARSVRAARALRVDLLTVHATGGPAMMEAARDAAGEDLHLLGVTVLTSLGAEELERSWGRRVESVSDEVGRLADQARRSGLAGAVVAGSGADVTAGRRMRRAPGRPPNRSFTSPSSWP